MKPTLIYELHRAGGVTVRLAFFVTTHFAVIVTVLAEVTGLVVTIKVAVV
jgi:hypothetical protein